MYQTPFLDLPPLLKAQGEVHLPGSKSISNRVLLLAALCQGVTTIHDLLDSDDTRVMLAALDRLGCHVESMGANTYRVTGLGAQLPVKQARLFMGNAGTAMRPLTAALALLSALHGGRFELSGVPRMHERPIGDLLDALVQLGCAIQPLGQPGYPPLALGNGETTALRLNTPIVVRGDVSSQFLTALLLALPLVSPANNDIEIVVQGELISKPYIAITLKLLETFGVAIRRDGWQRFTIVAGSQYRTPGTVHVEADASSASYFIALGAIAIGADAPDGLKIVGVGAASIQGDIRFVEAAQRMGAHVESGPNWLKVRRGAWPLQAIELDCNHIPDAAMTLAVMALYAKGTTTLTNIASWRVKETDRIVAMACELRKLGALVEEGPDFIRITPPATIQDWKAAAIHTYDDHRVAMCFSLAAFNPASKPVRILDPRCVGKTFPDYFETLFSVAQAQPEHIPVLCIDGPTASGKGTLANELAQRLGYHLLDSGVLYRLVGLAASKAGISTDPVALANAEAATTLGRLASQMTVVFSAGRTLLDGDDVTDAVRTEAAGMAASIVSALVPVRQALLELQHRFRQLPGLVADGRDMGTVIFPSAPLKVYLTATAEQRARRRHKQLLEKGQPAIIEDLLRALEQRDLQDKTRIIAPLKPAEDAVLLDNTDQTIEQSVETVLLWWHSKQPF